MPLFLGNRRVVAGFMVGLALSLGFVAVAGSAAPARRPLVAVLRAPVAAPLPAPVEASSGSLVVESVTIRPEAHPLDGLSAAELAQRVRATPTELGTAIVGRPNRG